MSWLAREGASAFDRHAGTTVFRDRVAAGRMLGARLATLAREQVLVLGIPRGGVPVAAEVARALDAELDVVVARKLGAPGQPELAIGAITADGARHLNAELIRRIGVPSDFLEASAQRERTEAQRRERRFRGERPPIEVRDRTVVVVDDGLATGATMFAAVDAVKRRGAKRVVVAVPVGARETCAMLAREADEVICLSQPDPFQAVGLHYQDFSQVSDDEVEQLLHAAAMLPRAGRP